MYNELINVNMIIEQAEQGLIISQQLIKAIKSIAHKQEAQQADIDDAKSKAQQAYDSICINDEEQAELHSIKDKKIADICRGRSFKPGIYLYSDYWKFINKTCGVSTYKKIKRKDFKKAKLAALSWKPKWLQ